jgi:UDP-N-acetylglucosamine acyltransferase
MTSRIHHTAIVDTTAELASDITVGPYSVIGSGVTVADGTVIAARVIIERDTAIGRRCHVGTGAVLGSAPQDLKYRGEPTRVEIGDDTRIREYATINRGTAARGVTRVGSNCYLMTYVHVAHDCIIEDGVTLANAVQLAGHVRVEPQATISGLTPVHQFVRIGTHAFVGGGSRVPQDVPPYTRAAGNPLRLYGINTIGLTRAGFPPEVRRALKHAYRLLFNSDLTTVEAVEVLQRELPDIPEVARLIAFTTRTERGVLV